MQRFINRRASGDKRLPHRFEEKLPRPSTFAGKYMARRYRVPLAVADLIASLAGLGGNHEGLL